MTEPKIPQNLQLNVNEIPLATNGLSTPTFYADVIRGAMVVGGVAKFNLVEHKMDALNEEIKAVHVATVVMPSDQLRAWAKFLLNMADNAGDNRGDGE